MIKKIIFGVLTAIAALIIIALFINPATVVLAIVALAIIGIIKLIKSKR